MLELGGLETSGQIKKLINIKTKSPLFCVCNFFVGLEWWGNDFIFVISYLKHLNMIFFLFSTLWIIHNIFFSCEGMQCVKFWYFLKN